MKTTKEIVGLPVISIADGIEVGCVKALIVNAEKGAIDYLMIDSGIQSNIKVIQVGDILGIGEDAVIIETSKVMFDTSEVQAAVDLLQRNVQIEGTKIFTKKGKLIGHVVEFSIDDEDNCSIKNIEYTTSTSDTKNKILNNDVVITYGKSIIIVSDNIVATNSESHINIQKTVPTGFPEEQPKLESSASLLFEERQKQYLKGKVLTKTILDMEGNSIFPEGTLIDDEVIEVAQQKGKFIEITMNNVVG